MPHNLLSSFPRPLIHQSPKYHNENVHSGDLKNAMKLTTAKRIINSKVRLNKCLTIHKQINLVLRNMQPSSENISTI